MVFSRFRATTGCQGHFSWAHQRFGHSAAGNQSSVSRLRALSIVSHSRHCVTTRPPLICRAFSQDCPILVHHTFHAEFGLIFAHHVVWVWPQLVLHLLFQTPLSSIIVSLSGTGWLGIGDLIRRQPPHVFSEAPPSRLPTTKGQSREWHLSEATRPLSFLFHPPASWDSVTFTKGWFISSGALALFEGGTLKGVERRQGGLLWRRAVEKGEKLRNEAWELWQNNSEREG